MLDEQTSMRRKQLPQVSDDCSLSRLANHIYLEHLAAELEVLTADVLLRQFSNAMNMELQKHRVLDLDGLRIVDGEANPVHRPGGGDASRPRPHCKMHIGIVPLSVSDATQVEEPMRVIEVVLAVFHARSDLSFILHQEASAAVPGRPEAQYVTSPEVVESNLCLIEPFNF